LGYGINNYIDLLGAAIGEYAYSHNNYVELLVGVGLIGTVVYYLAFIYIFRNAIRHLNNYSKFAIVTVITILIIDYGLVSYNLVYIQFFIGLAFSAILLDSQVNEAQKFGKVSNKREEEISEMARKI